VFQNGNIDYFYMMGIDNNTLLNHIHLMEAVKNNWTIRVVCDQNSQWAGSGVALR